MFSRRTVCLAYMACYIFFSIGIIVFELLVKVVRHSPWEEFQRSTIGTIAIFGVWMLFFFVKDLIRWQQVNGKIYPVFKREGMSPHFFQVAEEYGKTIDRVKISTHYWLNLLCYYQTMNQDDMALQTFTKVDASYIHSIKNSRGRWNRRLVKVFFNNGLSACLKTGHLDDAKRLYQDGFPYLKKNMAKDIAVLDTLAEYHFLMREYKDAAELYRKLLETGRLPMNMMKNATERLDYARQQCMEK